MSYPDLTFWALVGVNLTEDNLVHLYLTIALYIDC